MSPSLWYAGRAIFEAVKTAPFRPGRIYLDVGRREGEDTLADARQLRDLLLTKGYRRGDQLRYVEDRAGGHEEASWGRRLRAALPFLLAPPG
jgi:predicted alpha/beta superfamily hydrolase